MRINREEYQYVDKQDQYSDYIPNETPYVEAEYVRSKNPKHQGNPFVEALPQERDRNDSIKSFDIPLLNTTRTESSISEAEKIMLVGNLRDLRIPLPYDYLLEMEIYRSIRESYSARYQLYEEVEVEDRDCPSVYGKRQGKLVGNDASAAVVGFTFCGIPGTGKSAALQLALNNIPQVIYHNTTKAHITQITYLVVTCPANSNIRELLSAIGQALDKAVGNIHNEFETLVQKKKDVAGRAAEVTKLIENYAIGLIIFDEIQEMNFTRMNKDSFNIFVTISGRTKVAYGFVGTEEAKNKLYGNTYIARRAGINIESDSYTKDREIFLYIMKHIQKYQWIDEPVLYSSNIKNGKFDNSFYETMFQYTHGIIDRIITIYMYMQIEVIKNPTKAFDEGLIKYVVKTYFAGLEGLLQKRTKIAKTEELKIMENSKKQLDEMIKQQILIDTKKEILKNDYQGEENLRDAVISNVSKCFADVSIDTLANVYAGVRKKNPNATELALTSQVVAKLTNNQNSKAKATKKRKVSVVDIQQDLESAYGGKVL